MSIDSLPPALKEFRASLKAQASYSQLLQAAPIPSLRNWKPGMTEADWSYQTGRKKGFEEALRYMGKDTEIKDD